MKDQFLAVLVSLSFIVVTSSCDVMDTTEDARDIAGFESLSGPYLGQEPPGSEPKIFLPGLVTTEGMEGCVAFLDEAKVFIFFSSQKGTLYTYEKDGKWTSPQGAPFQNTYGSGITDFTAGPDGRTLYFQSSRPTTPDDTERDANIWVVEWTGSGWTEPFPLPPLVNTDQNSELYPSVSRDETVYFFARSQPDPTGDIYRSSFAEGGYLAHERLDFPVNSAYYEVDPVVAPDGSYLLFGSARPGGFSLSDLYVSFRRSDDGWSHPYNVGKKINELIFAIRMSVTPDGKYFFFLSQQPTPIPKGERISSPSAERWGDSDVYWVDTGFIDALERTVRNKKCAAEVIREEYGASGLGTALEKMAELVHDDDYYFEVSELMILCGSMIESGELIDAERFSEALTKAFPDDDLRIQHGYAVAHILNGSTPKGLELLKEVWTRYPSTKPALSMIMLSFQLLAKSRGEDALKVLEFGAREIGTFNAYLDLSEAHARLGNKEQAIESCKKALDLKPNFVDALDLLEKLEQ